MMLKGDVRIKDNSLCDVGTPSPCKYSSSLFKKHQSSSESQVECEIGSMLLPEQSNGTKKIEARLREDDTTIESGIYTL